MPLILGESETFRAGELVQSRIVKHSHRQIRFETRTCKFFLNVFKQGCVTLLKSLGNSE